MARIGRREAWTLAALVAFVVLLALVEARWTPLHRFDVDVADDLTGWTARHDTVRHALMWVSDGGQPLVFQVAAVLAAIALWRVGRPGAAVFVPVTVFGASLLSTLVKHLVGRTRPEIDVPLVHPAGSSFPSGHALTSIAACGVAVLVLHRTLVAVAAVLVAVAIGYSRLALGAHYVSDVLGAWLIGAVWLYVTTTLVLRRDPVSARDRR